MSLPECGFENNTKFSSVRKREILHQDIFDAVLLESGYNVANIYINARYKECHGWFQVVRTIKLLTVKKHDVIMANVFKRCLFLTVILLC